MKCPFCPAQLAYIGEEHDCAYPELSRDDPAGPEDFRGSDEESHYMSSRQAFGDPPRASRGRRGRPVRRQEHELKTWPDRFQAMIDGTKTFELRRDDRGFQVDDRLILCEWDPETEAYTGRRARFSVTYVTDGAAFGALADGFVCLGLRPIDRKTALTAARAEKALIEFRKTTEDAELYPGLTRAAFDAGRRFEQGLGARSRPDDLRARGWAVAVHNDYRQDAVPHTFWLFTKGELAAKGKGRTDAEALDAARRDIDRLEAK